MARELSLQELSELREAFGKSQGGTPYHLGRVIRELDRVLTAVNRLQCLLMSVPCMTRRAALADAGGTPCGCANCRIFREVWDG
jgi:hypothetical protein